MARIYDLVYRIKINNHWGLHKISVVFSTFSSALEHKTVGNYRVSWFLTFQSLSDTSINYIMMVGDNFEFGYVTSYQKLQIMTYEAL